LPRPPRSTLFPCTTLFRSTVKRILPDSHADFVFAVAAEEFGIVLCLILLALFAFIVMRALVHAFRAQDAFARFAIAGLGMLFGQDRKSTRLNSSHEQISYA